MVNRIDFQPKDAEKLQAIPGLKLHGLHATGSVDAIDAAKFVLNPQSVKPVRHTDGVPNKVNPKGARQYQKFGINWLIQTLSKHGGAILGDEMGLGKTFQTIQMLRHTMVGRALVLCPGSVRETWREELLKFGYKPEEIAILYSGGKDWDRSPSCKVVVCSHDYRMIDRTMTLSFAGETPEFLVLDEAHRFRGRKNKRIDVMEDTAALIPYKVGLTGSPQWNSMKDWYSLLHILFGYRFGGQWDFDKRYAGAKPGIHGGLDYPKKDDAKITPKILNTEELQIRLSHYMLARLKSEVAADMPPLTISMRWVDPTPEAKRALQKMQMGGRSSGSPVHDAIVATLRGKVEEVLALAGEAKRFVLCTWTNAGAADLHRLLNEQGTPCLLATASMSGQKRAAVIREAVDRGCGLVATIDLFAEGLNLQKVASVGILHALDFVPEKMRQLMARLHRIDIVDPVTWHVVAMRESVDQYIIDAGVFKLDAMERMLGKKTELRGALKDDKKEAASEKTALENLYALMEEGDHGEDDE